MKIPEAFSVLKTSRFRQLFWGYWLPVLIWCGNIFSLSSSDQPVKIVQTYYRFSLKADILGHFLEYAVLGILMARAFLNSKESWKRGSFCLCVTAACAFYGMLDEGHQFFVAGRSMTLEDWLYDVLFSLAAALFYQRLMARPALTPQTNLS